MAKATENILYIEKVISRIITIVTSNNLNTVSGIVSRR
jgi:hypothetical protein